MCCSGCSYSRNFRALCFKNINLEKNRGFWKNLCFISFPLIIIIIPSLLSLVFFLLNIMFNSLGVNGGIVSNTIPFNNDQQVNWDYFENIYCPEWGNGHKGPEHINSTLIRWDNVSYLVQSKQDIGTLNEICEKSGWLGRFPSTSVYYDDSHKHPTTICTCSPYFDFTDKVIDSGSDILYYSAGGTIHKITNNTIKVDLFELSNSYFGQTLGEKKFGAQNLFSDLFFNLVYYLKGTVEGLKYIPGLSINALYTDLDPLGPLSASVEVLMMLLFPIALSFTFPNIASRVVRERKKGLTSYMQIFGISSFQNETSRFFFDYSMYCIFCIISIVVPLCGVMDFFIKGKPYEYLPLFFCWGPCMISCGYLFSWFFNDESLCAGLGYILLFLSFVLGLLINMLISSDVLPTFIYFMFPPFAFQRALANIISDYKPYCPHPPWYHFWIALLWMIGETVVIFGVYLILQNELVPYIYTIIRRCCCLCYEKIYIERKRGYKELSDNDEDIDDEEEEEKRIMMTQKTSEGKKDEEQEGSLFDKGVYEDIEVPVEVPVKEEVLIQQKEERDIKKMNMLVPTQEGSISSEEGDHHEIIRDGMYGDDDDIGMVREEEKQSILHEPTEVSGIGTGKTVGREILRMHRLTKYYGTKKVLGNVTLTIRENECFGLLGPNGAGKTTLLNIITGSLRPTHGWASVNGRDCTVERRYVRGETSICPQFDVMEGLMTVSQTLYFFCRLRNVKGIKKHVKKLIKQVDLDAYRSQLARNLSGGSRRRLAIAVALVGDPSIVFLDEPTTGLDPASCRSVWDVIERIKKDRTVVLTSHSMFEVETLCSRVALLSRGEVKCVGDLLSLKNKYGKGLNLSFICREQYHERADEYITSILPEGSISEKVMKKDKIVYRLPFGSESEVPTGYAEEVNESRIKFSELFEMFDDESLRKYGVVNWNIDQASLEEVFLRVVLEDEKKADKRMNIFEVVVDYLCCFCCFMGKGKKREDEETEDLML